MVQEKLQSSGIKKSSNSGRKKDSSRWTVTKEELTDGEETHIAWSEMDNFQRLRHITLILLKLALLLFVIFMFICTLGLLADAFKLIGGRGIGDAVKNSRLIQNPISASIIGMVITLILQSSSTLISILVGMVAGRIITVHEAIPVMMGAEIGASFFNALISLGQSGNRDQFRRAFAAATMNDIFNFLSYLVILPLELTTGVIEKVSALFVEPLSGAKGSKFDTLNIITDPLLHRIIQLDEDAINEVSQNNRAEYTNESLILKCIANGTDQTTVCPYEHLFAYSTWSDALIGIILLVISICLLIVCLVGIVRLLNSLLAGHIAIWVRRIIDRQLPHPFGWLTNYLVMLFGCFVVMIVQSSGVFRSALIPLVGIGVVPLERFYPLLLGANVGTTFTGVLAALSADPRRLRETMQIALCQTVYNLLSILFYYPVPLTRRIPITLAMRFGDLTAKYRWFALVYIFFVFFLMPASLLVLSFLPSPLMITIVLFLALFIGAIVLINLLQRNHPSVLPRLFRNWNFLPKHFRSLQPYDRSMSKLFMMLPFFYSRQRNATQSTNKNFQTKAAAAAYPFWLNSASNNNGGDKNIRVNFISPQIYPIANNPNIRTNSHPLTNSTHFPPWNPSQQTDV